MSTPVKTGDDVSNRLKSLLEFNSSVRKKLQEKGKATSGVGGESSSAVADQSVSTPVSPPSARISPTVTTPMSPTATSSPRVSALLAQSQQPVARVDDLEEIIRQKEDTLRRERQSR